MKWAVVALASVHGLIHLMGFVNELSIAKVQAVSGSTTITLSEPLRRGLGLAWLLGCCLLITAAVALAMNQGWWKPVLVSGAVLSQLLIVVWWRDAWAGSIANTLLLLGLYLHKV